MTKYGYACTFTGVTSPRGEATILHIVLIQDGKAAKYTLCGRRRFGKAETNLEAGQLCQNCRRAAALRGLGEVERLKQ